MGKFLIHKVPTGVTFHLKADNGQNIATSEVYASMESCKNGIESVRNNCKAHVEDQTVPDFEALKHPKFEVYTDKAGHCRFRLKAKNGEIIAASEPYSSKASCMHGVESVGHNAPEAKIEIEE